MSRQALYRLYRPRRFQDVAGQEQPIRILREAVRQSRLTHAYLFSGPRGTGKTSVARILAKAVNCDAAPALGEPCLECQSCQALESGRHLDVIEIDAASNRGIDEIRDIKERIAHLPVMSRFKVYIIDEVHMLTAEAFNALLKTLEEPPGHVMFILATTEPHKLPVTVLSRCQRYEFERLTVAQIAQRLQAVADAEQIRTDAEGLERIAAASDGALRDALSLLDQAVAMQGDRVSREVIEQLLGAMDRPLLEQMVEALLSSEPERVLRAAEAAYHKGGDVRHILRDLAQVLRDLAVLRHIGVTPEGVRGQWVARVSDRLGSTTGAEAWFAAVEILAETEDRLRGGFPPQLLLELAVFKIQRTLNGDAPQPKSVVSKVIPAPVRPSTPAPAKPSSPAPVESEPVHEGDGVFSRLLDRIRRERPSTYALLQAARIQEEPGRIIVWFQFPAHRDVLQSPANRVVFDEALRAVYGSQYTAEFRVGKEPAEVPTQPPGFDEVQERVRSLLGDEVLIVDSRRESQDDRGGHEGGI